MLVLVAGCQIGELDARGKGNGSGSGSGSGAGNGAECLAAKDCVAVGVKCCDCPTFAVPINDPTRKACTGVSCPPMGCIDNVEAACVAGQCVLACKPLVTTMTCADGFATDATGCLTANCAMPDTRECAVDGDCARTRGDCCGCANGGFDTSVPASQVAAHEAMLGCPSNPTCSGNNSCPSPVAAKCIAGSCQLVAGTQPPNLCGRPDLPPCVGPEECFVNANDNASMQGLGVCRAP